MWHSISFEHHLWKYLYNLLCSFGGISPSFEKYLWLAWKLFSSFQQAHTHFMFSQMSNYEGIERRRLEMGHGAHVKSGIWSRTRRCGPRLLPCGSFPHKVNHSSVLSPPPPNLQQPLAPTFEKSRLNQHDEEVLSQCLPVIQQTWRFSQKPLKEVRSDGFNIRLPYHLKNPTFTLWSVRSKLVKLRSEMRIWKSGKDKAVAQQFLLNTQKDHPSLWNQSILSAFKTDHFLKWSISICIKFFLFCFFFVLFSF